MRTIKLTSGQLEKMIKAQQAENATASQLQLAQANARVATQQRQDIFELILESAGIDPKSIPKGSQVILRNNILEIPTAIEKKSQAIRRAINTKKTSK